MESITTRAYKWIVGENVGISSKTIWAVMMGVEKGSYYSDTPYDPDDFRRCHILLDYIPEWRAHLHDVSSLHPSWKGLVDNWDELENLYEKESNRQDKIMPLLYVRMQRLLYPACLQSEVKEKI